MDVKRKIFDIRTWSTTFISRHILQKHWHTCPIRRNPQYISLSTLVSAISPLLRASSAIFERPWENFFTQFWTALYVKHFPQPTGNISLYIYIYILHSVLLPTKTHNRTLIFCSIFPKSPSWLLKPESEHVHARLLARISWSWTVLLPSDARRKLLRPIQLFNFCLWPIYWLLLLLLLLSILLFTIVFYSLQLQLNLSLEIFGSTKANNLQIIKL
jgi:hypothetical protein